MVILLAVLVNSVCRQHGQIELKYDKRMPGVMDQKAVGANNGKF